MIYPAPKHEPSPPKEQKRVKRRNVKRHTKEWLRAYGSSERVKWFNAQSCLGCGGGPSENAHTINGGGSRKADARFVVPLCGDQPNMGIMGCHTRYDKHIAPFGNEVIRERIKSLASHYDNLWKSVAGGGEPE